jgi:hypothetical protein
MADTDQKGLELNLRPFLNSIPQLRYIDSLQHHGSFIADIGGVYLHENIKKHIVQRDILFLNHSSIKCQNAVITVVHGFGWTWKIIALQGNVNSQVISVM